MTTLDDLTEPPPGHRDWNGDGIVQLRGSWAPPDWDRALARYEQAWRQHNATRPGGWPYETPYMEHPEILELLLHPRITEPLEVLMGEPAGLHLVLSGWVSTERDWHQDGYLNPAHVGDYYAAVWIALDDVHPDSGPFEFVAGSHRWPRLARERFASILDLSRPDWPTESERLLRPLYDAEIIRRQATVTTYLPRRGDVLIWHPGLVHRGSKPLVPGMERRAVIAHYSGVDHRPDMPAPRLHHRAATSHAYFPIVTHPRPAFPR